MEKKKMAVILWIKKHKTKLIIVGISITTITALILEIRNYKTLQKIVESLQRIIEQEPENIFTAEVMLLPDTMTNHDIATPNAIPSCRLPHNVSRHIRNLHEGWEPSADKLASAKAHGFDLQPGQTWVEHYRTKEYTA